METLLKEIDLVTGVLGKGRSVSHIHWGGGSSTILTQDEIKRLGAAFTTNFSLTSDAEFTVEIDLREVGQDLVAAIAASALLIFDGKTIALTETGGSSCALWRQHLTLVWAKVKAELDSGIVVSFH